MKRPTNQPWILFLASIPNVFGLNIRVPLIISFHVYGVLKVEFCAAKEDSFKCILECGKVDSGLSEVLGLILRLN